MSVFATGARPLARRTLAMLATTLSVAALTACGGGGDDDSPVEKYAGDWYDSCTASGSNSYRYKASVSKTGNKSMRVVIYELQFNNTTTCAGTAASQSQVEVTEDTHDGTKSIDGKTVDKFISREGSSTSKYIVYRNGNALYFGESGDDGNGYETTLETTPSFTR